MKNIFLFLTVLILVTGCSSKKSLFVPGQSESDCDEKASKLGVCGTPKAIYENKDKIKNIWFEDDEAYYVKKNGKIYNTNSGEEVIPGKKPSGCNNAICPNCDNIADKDHEHSSGCSHDGAFSSKKLMIKNKSLVISTPQKTTMMRDLGWQQKIWIAPLQTKGDDLIEAHSIYIVVKKPSWIIGEEVPRKIKRGVIVPSILTKEVLNNNHHAIKRSINENIDNYVREEYSKKLNSIKNYIQEQKGK